MSVSGTNARRHPMTDTTITAIENIASIEELESKIAPDSGVAALDGK
jgi:hypothetical protein